MEFYFPANAQYLLKGAPVGFDAPKEGQKVRVTYTKNGKRLNPSKFAALTKGVLIGELLCGAATVGILVWTAHLGGTLVYEQGAGYLREPNVNCPESQDSNEPVNPDRERSDH